MRIRLCYKIVVFKNDVELQAFESLMAINSMTLNQSIVPEIHHYSVDMHHDVHSVALPYINDTLNTGDKIILLFQVDTYFNGLWDNHCLHVGCKYDEILGLDILDFVNLPAILTALYRALTIKAELRQGELT